MMDVPSKQLKMAIAKDMVEVVVNAPSLDAKKKYIRGKCVKSTSGR